MSGNFRQQLMDFYTSRYTTGHFCFTQRRHARNALPYQRQSVSIVANFAALREKCPVVCLTLPSFPEIRENLTVRSISCRFLSGK
jgi:hypothetical protein